ncbi:Kinesin-related motor protein [Saitoella coloradoensis]
MRPPAARPPSRTASRTGTYTSSRPSAASTTRAPPARSSSSSSIQSTTAAPAAPRPKKKEVETDEETNIQVVVRCRGRNDREIKENSGVVLSLPGGTRGREVCVQNPVSSANPRMYTFDRVFGPEADQGMVYDAVVAPILQEVLEGYNCTIFAYGQTGTGKTFTMSGDVQDNPNGTFKDGAGIIPRTLFRLFHALDVEDMEYSVKISYIELYNEELKDLLATDETAKIRIIEEPKKGVVVQGIEEALINTAAEGMKVLQDGTLKRQIAATKMNDMSSRSHSVFTITVYVKEKTEGEDMLKVGKLHLVDLAGSENIQRSGAENKRAREAGMINQSLLTLGRVINSLVERSSHIPYRESKLTRLLQDSLGGRTKTCIIATVSPAKVNLDETLSTLDYANRAKNIRNKPQANQLMTKKALIKEYVQEIERLKSDLSATRTKNGIYLTTESFEEMKAESESRRLLAEEGQRRIEVIEASLKSTREQFDQNMLLLTNTKRELTETSKTLADTQTTLEGTEKNLEVTKKAWVEENVLRKAHQTTEFELDTVAQELRGTVGATVKDVEGLHAKVDRKAEVEAYNQNAFKNLQGRAKQMTEELDKGILDFTKKQDIFAAGLEEKVSEFVAAEAKKLADGQVYVESALSKFAQSKQELEGNLGAAKEDMSGVLGEIKTLREGISVKLNEALTGLNGATERIATEVITEIVQFQQGLNTSFHDVGAKLKALTEDTQRHLQAQQDEIERLRGELVAANKATSANLLTTSANLASALQQERADAQREREQMLAQITALFGSMSAAQDQRWAEKVASAQAGLEASRQAGDASTSAFNSGVDSWLEKDRTYARKFVEMKGATKNQLITGAKYAMEKGVAIQESTKAIHAETVALVDNQISVVDAQVRELDEFVTRARAQVAAHHEAHANSVETLGAGVTSTYANFQSALGNIKGDVDSFGAKIVPAIQQHKPTIGAFQTAAANHIAGIRKDVTTSELKEDVPTGQTPKKKVYTYTQTWNTTKPHSEILAVFRGEKAVGSADDATMDGAPDAGSPIGSAAEANGSIDDVMEDATGLVDAMEDVALVAAPPLAQPPVPAKVMQESSAANANGTRDSRTRGSFESKMRAPSAVGRENRIRKPM